jgi:hypothetical protein
VGNLRLCQHMGEREKKWLLASTVVQPLNDHPGGFHMVSFVCKSLFPFLMCYCDLDNSF